MGRFILCFVTSLAVRKSRDLSLIFHSAAKSHGMACRLSSINNLTLLELGNPTMRQMT